MTDALGEPKTHKTRKLFTRRRFLAGLAALAAAISACNIEPQNEIPKDTTLVIDIAPGFDNEGLVRRLIDPNFKTKVELEQELGIDLAINDRRQFNKKVLEKYPITALAHRFIDGYGGHGQLVADTIKASRLQLGYRGDVQIEPLQPIFVGNLKFVKNREGNWTVSAEIPPEPLIERIARFPNSKVVNLSFPVGSFSFTLVQYELSWNGKKSYTTLPYYYQPDSAAPHGFYIYPFGVGEVERYGRKVVVDKDGNEVEPMTAKQWIEYDETLYYETGQKIENEDPYVFIEGAYNEDKALDNLRKLFQICNRFPDKNIVVAGGNTQENILEARYSLKDNWPPNLLMVAEWDAANGRPFSQVHGMDLYVDTKTTYPKGSSIASPIAATVVEALRLKGLSPAEAVTKVIQLSKEVTYLGYGQMNSTHLLSLDALRLER